MTAILLPLILTNKDERQMSYAAVNIEDIVTADWRDDIKCSIVLAIIHEVFTEFDRSGEINIQLTDGRGPKVIELRRVREQ